MGPVCFDFETHGIEQRPNYPPKPVGLAIQYPGRDPHYYSWAHPTGNNCTMDYARIALEAAYRHEGGVLAQNFRFDADVAEVHMGLKPPAWNMVHDTQLLMFLNEPHALTYSLKPSATRLLNMPPDEQDAVATWLIENHRPNGKKLTKKQTGAYICQAPGELVGAYACGDVVRTMRLFDLLYPKIKEAGMLEPYNRERKLLPILLDMERQGIRVDLSRLHKDIPTLERLLGKADRAIYESIGDVNVDSNGDLVDALEKAGKLNRADLPKTPTGKDKADKDALDATVNDTELLTLLRYRGALSTCLRTFLLPWYETAKQSSGRVFTSWHSIRGEYGGARTGRLSSSPSMMNIPKEFKVLVPKGFPPLPKVREFMLPDEGCVWVKRDYSAQEYRVLGHYEDAEIMRSFIDDPNLDPHTAMKERVKASTGIDIARQHAKIVVFCQMYGGGPKKIAALLGITDAQATELRDAVRAASPGMVDLDNRLKYIFRQGQAIRTWGGRVYHVEPPEMGERDDGTTYAKRTFDYKALNYLVQGSSADITKEAVVRYDSLRKHGRLLVTVHDELDISVPIEHLASEMAILREAMNDVPLDVPLLSEGSVGENWGGLSARVD